MKITGLIWLEDIVEKLLYKHNVQQQEVRELFDGFRAIYLVEKGHYPGENVYALLGQTSAGRYLVVFFVHKQDGRALVLSARDMTMAERKRYERK